MSYGRVVHGQKNVGPPGVGRRVHIYCGLVVLVLLLLLLLIIYNFGDTTMDSKTLRSNHTDVNNYYYNFNELEDNNPAPELKRCILL